MTPDENPQENEQQPHERVDLHLEPDLPPELQEMLDAQKTVMPEMMRNMMEEAMRNTTTRLISVEKSKVLESLNGIETDGTWAFCGMDDTHVFLLSVRPKLAALDLTQHVQR